MDADSNIQIRIQFPEQNKTKIDGKVILNFKLEHRTLKSYTAAFKKRVLTRLEERDNNKARTTREFNIYRKKLQRWNNQKDVIIKVLQKKRVGLLL